MAATFTFGDGILPLTYAKTELIVQNCKEVRKTAYTASTHVRDIPRRRFSDVRSCCQQVRSARLIRFIDRYW